MIRDRLLGQFYYWQQFVENDLRRQINERQ